MYSRLNLIINELHSIGLIKLDDTDIVRKIISVLLQKKYASIITILHNMEDLSTMTPGIVIGKLVAFEMSRKMGQEEASSSSKGKALACSEKKKMKDKQVETSSSSSSSSEEEEEDEDNDDDDEDSSDDDQSSSSTSDLDEESKAQCQGCAHPNPRSHFHKSKKRANKERMLWMRRDRALCGSLFK